MLDLLVSACVLRATTKKSRQLFPQEKKCTPENILATPMNLPNPAGAHNGCLRLEAP